MLAIGPRGGSIASRRHVRAFPAERTGRVEAISKQPLRGRINSAYLVELVAQINRVDVVALQIREHDDLRRRGRVSHDHSSRKGTRGGENPLTKKTIEKRRAAAMKTAKRKSHAAGEKWWVTRGSRFVERCQGRMIS
jgi:hypothetical protein